MRQFFLSTIILALLATETRAQLLNEMFEESTYIDTLPERSLRLDIDAAGFFRDNEYESEIQSGYSLPGVRLTPHLAYNPLQAINIELGASMLFFNGANKYPCYAYHDIGTWKGTQYQHGAHVLPWVRLQASLKNLDVVVGDIYGAANHGLIQPLFNSEQNLSADPEMGVQILLHRPHVNLDVWLNWQSYQFELDSHQEAFTVGTATKLFWGKKGEQANGRKGEQTTPPRLYFYSPIQLLIQHRGGEQDTTSRGVQTICNASAGIGLRWTPGQARSAEYTAKQSPLNHLDAQLNILGCMQQSGNIWPFDTGCAWHAGVTTKWWNHLGIGLDYTNAPKQFISLYGNPFYSTVTIKESGTIEQPDGTLTGTFKHQYKGIHTVHLGIDYEYTFAQAYTLGADAELYSLHSKKRLHEEGKLSEMSFSFGLYLRVSPSFLLKKWK